VGKYREAYRLDPDVDQLVRKSAQLSLGPGAPAAPAAAATGGAAKPPISDTHDDDDGHEYRYRPHAHTAALVRAGAPAGRSEEPLVEQLARADTELQPLDPARPVPVAVLPPEVIVRVFQLVADDSLRNLARASKVCRAWYVLAQEPGVWRHICLRTWPELDPAELLRFGASWKRMFMDRPCVRTDGIYIARINYVRQVRPVPRRPASRPQSKPTRSNPGVGAATAVAREGCRARATRRTTSRSCSSRTFGTCASSGTAPSSPWYGCAEPRRRCRHARA